MTVIFLSEILLKRKMSVIISAYVVKGAVLYNEVIDSIARNEMSNNPAPGKEYIGEEGFLHCGICGEPVQQYVEGDEELP